MKHSLSLIHLVRQPPAATERPPLLVLLHGYGSNEHDLFGLVPYLDQRFFVVSVRAPYTIMPGGYGWFELNFAPNELRFNPLQAETSRQQLIQFIDEAIHAYETDAARTFLLGFSQGATMAASVALTQPTLVAGAALLSGWVPLELLSNVADAEQLSSKPFFVSHGTIDPVLPVQLGRDSRDTLTKLSVALTYREYQMGHEVILESLQDVTAWLKEQLDQIEDN